MRYIALLLASFSSLVSAEMLLTDSYSIQIERECKEGNVTCDNVRFTYIYGGSDEKNVAMGSTVHSLCADGETPCSFKGYTFSAGSRQYFIRTSGTLEVLDHEGNQALLEQGTWKK